ncbi:MAG TPA: short-chain fatty acid transporter [Firmicutes bacterium]|nr:short-chain fatty acid transporter [Bacillota bacterium]
MLRRLGDFFTGIMEKYLPDAYLFAVLLTFLAFILALIFTGKGPLEIIDAWWGGVWSLLAFSMQMVLVLVTGHCLALAPAMKRLLAAIAGLAKTPAQAVIIVTLVAGICSWLQWGFGLIVGGLLALELVKKVEKVDYPLLIAGAYGGFVVWHQGISGSVPLTVASPGNPANHLEKIAKMVVPVSQTVFAPWNLIPAWIIILSLPFLLAMAAPSPDKAKVLDPKVLMNMQKEEEEEEKRNRAFKPRTWAEKVENSMLVNYIFCAMGVIFFLRYFAAKGFNLDLNIVNGLFLFAGLILHRTPINYVRAVEKAIKGAGGIVLQFPVYGGIQGIMMGTGLAAVIAGWFVAISSKTTFYMLQYWAAGLINMFIPSGGGQWAAQGSISIMAAQKMGVDPVKTAMAVAWGDQWTNMIQPFWALPLLGLAGLKAKDIMGYTTLVLIWSGIILSIAAIVMAL